jgi:Xaa-Pro aminopeptidase
LRMRNDVDQILAEKGFGAMLLYSDSSKNANMYYMTGLLTYDPFIFLKKVDEDPILIINQLELTRAQRESVVKDVRSYSDYDFMQIVKSATNFKVGAMKFVASVAKKELGTSTPVYVPPNLSVMLADFLRKNGLKVKPAFDIIEKARETKEPDEVEAIRLTQTIVEHATKKAIDFLAEADVGSDGRLYCREGGKKQLLTVGKLRPIFDHTFADEGCIAEEETIIACGSHGAMGHYTGESRDVVRADEPVLLDVFPRSVKTRYFSDMARTVVKGRATKKLKDMFETVLQVRNAAMDAARAGVKGSEMQLLCYDLFEKAGYMTIRGGRKVSKGYNHSLGHGVGLEVHEGPGMGELSKPSLVEHNVVTIEPSLMDPKIGAVGIEDIVEITNTGFRNLSTMDICLEI